MSEHISRLDALATFFTDGDWVESKDQDPSGDIRLIQLADIGIGAFLDKSSRYLNSATAARLKCTFLQPGDILIARMPDPIGRACIFPDLGRQCATVVDVCILRVDQQTADPHYVMHCINSAEFRRLLGPMLNGTTRVRISRSKLAGLGISLPPLPEQERIAAILDKADGVRLLHKVACSTWESLERSAFYEAFGDPLSSGRSDLRPLGEHIKLINGRAYKQDELLKAGTPVLRIQNLNNGNRWYYSNLDLPEAKYCQAGDLLFAWSATFGPYLWNGPKAIFHYHIWRLEMRPTVEKLYVYWLLKIIADEVKRSGRGISMTHATKGGMEKRMIPIPHLDAQRKFSEQVREIHHLRARQTAACALHDAMSTSLQHRAFRGEL